VVMDRAVLKPTARDKGLLVRELPEETLVYDLKTHEAHCLNPSAAVVWKHADGRTTVAQLTRRLADVGLPGDEAVVWMALECLHKSQLLQESIEFPEVPPQFSRKAVLGILGKAAGLSLVLPAVSSVVAPLAAQAASCFTNAECNALDPQYVPGCTGLPICGKRKCCREVAQGGSTVCSPNQNC
jgi:hypothetical protein